MTTFEVSRRALWISAATALLAGCGGSQLPIGTPRSDALAARPLTAYTSLYSFQGKPDGEAPEARVIPFDNVLYGTTSAGGTKCARRGCGTVFKLTSDERELVLHRFQGVPDGAEPLAELVASGKELYGTTYNGGAVCTSHKHNLAGCGTVFEISVSGAEQVLHRFMGIPDGAYPQGPLTEMNGRFYGTTTSGGQECAREGDGCGTVYTIDSSGKERTLYRFSGEPDGALPIGNLVSLNGILYGTTYNGGTSDEGA
ncbi:MAG: choice-of-anchor tandem repeat GloVer-containing protein, partial [Candidatus Baltobacteraceae bacterium]